MRPNLQTPTEKANLVFIVLAAITAAVYWPGLDGGFLFDDLHTIQNNGWIKISEIGLSELRKAAYSFEGGGRELSMLTFALNYWLSGSSSFGFKLGNLALHIATGLGVYLFCRGILALILPRPDAQARMSVDGDHAYLPAILAGLWMLHPINLTSVLYISQRMTILATLFIVYGLVIYVKGRFEMRHASGKGLALCWSSLIIFPVLGFASKESGILLLPLAALVEWTSFGFRDRSGGVDRAVVTVFLTLLGIPFVAGLCWFAWNPAVILGGYGARQFDVWERLFTESRVLWYYASLVLLPRIDSLGFWHDDIPISKSLFVPVTTILSVLGLAAMAVLALVALRSWKLIGLGLLWFLVAHSLESTIIPLELVHEHRNYLASIGLLMAAAGFLQRGSLLGVPASFIVMLLAMTAFSVVTSVRAWQFGNPYIQALKEVEHHPRSANAHYALGSKYAIAARAGVDGAKDGAVEHIDLSAELEEYNTLADVTRALNFAFLDAPYPSGWSDRVTSKIDRYPALAPTIASLKLLLNCLEKDLCEFPESDRDAVFEAAAASHYPPIMALAGFYFANVRQDMERAGMIFREAVELSPKEPSHRLNLASYLVAIGEDKEAGWQLAVVKNLSFRSTFRHQARIEELEAELAATK